MPTSPQSICISDWCSKEVLTRGEANRDLIACEMYSLGNLSTNKRTGKAVKVSAIVCIRRGFHYYSSCLGPCSGSFSLVVFI